MHLTWITPKWPLPADDGAKQASTQLLRELTRAGIDIHLCSIVADGVPADIDEVKRALGLKNATVIRRRPSTKMEHLSNLLTRPTTSLTLAPYDSRSIAALLERAIESHSGTITVYDGLHAAAWALGADGSRKPRARPAVYRAHNVERDLWFRAAVRKKDPVSRGFLRTQGHRVERLEKALAEQALVVFPVSDTDSHQFRKMAPRTPVVTIPIGIEVAAESPEERGVREARAGASGAKAPLLFVGKLDWAPNRDGLRWLLEKIWPKVEAQRPDLELAIVGSGDGSWLKPFLGSKSIRFLGRVESVTPCYRDCLATIVPVFYGSGTRVKVIEASLHERACIGTALGVEGIGLVPGTSYIQAETEQDWVDAIVHLTQGHAEAIAKNARETVSEIFDSRSVAKRFLAALNQELLKGAPA